MRKFLDNGIKQPALQISDPIKGSVLVYRFTIAATKDQTTHNS